VFEKSEESIRPSHVVVSRLIDIDFSESIESRFASGLSRDELNKINNPVPYDGYSQKGSRYRDMNDEFRSRMKNRS